MYGKLDALAALGREHRPDVAVHLRVAGHDVTSNLQNRTAPKVPRLCKLCMLVAPWEIM